MKSTTKTLWEMSMCYVGRRKSTVMRTKGRMRKEKRRNRHERLVFHFGPKDIVAGNLREWVFLFSVYCSVFFASTERRRLIILFHDNFHSSFPFTFPSLDVMSVWSLSFLVSILILLFSLWTHFLSLSSTYSLYSHEFNLMISFIPFLLRSSVTDHLLFVFIKTLRGT